MKKIDVTALGELLIDFIETKKSEQNNRLFEANPGGAPCNVLAMLNKLGDSTAIIGKVGKDSLGLELKERVTSLGIDTKYLYLDEITPTTLAFVSKLPNGDRDFSFYRNPGADMMLVEEEVKEEQFEKSKIFHFGTLSMTNDGIKKATIKALEFAKKQQCLISFDPNLREPLWDDLKDAKDATHLGLSYTDILKISDNEIRWLSGYQDLDQGIKWLRQQYDISLIVLSCGADGSKAYYKDITVEQAAFLSKETIETTGAGDTFGGCVLHFVLKYGIESLNEMNLQEMLLFANAAASIITKRKGALMVMPEKSEIEELIYGKK